MAFFYFCFAALLASQIGTCKTIRLRYLGAGAAMFLIAGLRGAGVDHDYLGYIQYYNNILHAGFSNVEPTFVLLTHLIHSSVDNIQVLFVIYAALGIGLKLAGIARLSRYPMASLLVYFSGFFLVWEMTQIRAAVAGGLLLLAVPYIAQRRLLPFLALWGLAVLFHYAALVLLPLYLLGSDKIKAGFYYLLVPAASLMYLSQFDLVQLASFAPLQLVELKIRTYETYADPEVDNIFNAVYLSRCALGYFLLYHRSFLRQQNPFFPVLLKIYFAALFIHVALASIPGVSSRLSEMMLVVEVILIPMLVPFFKDRLAGYSLVTVAGLMFFVFSLHYTKLMMGYNLSPLLFQ